jgi:hypothetical protein
VATRACAAAVDAHGIVRCWMCCGAWRDAPCAARLPAKVEVLLLRMAVRPAVDAVAGSEGVVNGETEVDRRRRSSRRSMQRCCEVQLGWLGWCAVVQHHTAGASRVGVAVCHTPGQGRRRYARRPRRPVRVANDERLRPCAMLRAVLSRWEDRTERTGTVVTIAVAVLTVGGCAYLLGRRHGAGQPQGVAAAGLGAGGRAGRSAGKDTIATSTWTDWLLGRKPKRMPGASSIRMVIVVHRHGARVPNK